VKLHATPLSGLIEVETTPHIDARGAFARAFCLEEFRVAGINFSPVQTSLSMNTAAFTLRGLHFQYAPHAEAKLVRAVAGRAFDVAVDLRAGATFGHWHGVELCAARMNAIFIPPGFAHGFLTLEPATTLLYHMSPLHVAGHGRGIRWDDPDIAITWPSQPQTISDADCNLPVLAEAVACRP